MTDLPVHLFSGLGGVELAWREVGSGRHLVLLHGLMGSGALLAGQGLVPALAERGYRVILPDLRGHGDSGRPHDPACYPADVLADDMLALIAHLGLDDYDLGGYSMGGKLVLRLLARGARPARAVVGGQGLDALDAESDRTNGHRRIRLLFAAQHVRARSFPPRWCGTRDFGPSRFGRHAADPARYSGRRVDLLVRSLPAAPSADLRHQRSLASTSSGSAPMVRPHLHGRGCKFIGATTAPGRGSKHGTMTTVMGPKASHLRPGIPGIVGRECSLRNEWPGGLTTLCVWQARPVWLEGITPYTHVRLVEVCLAD